MGFAVALLLAASAVLSFTSAGKDDYSDLEALMAAEDKYVKDISEKYLFVNENKEWSEALLFCYTMDRDMVAISNAVEQKALADYLSS